MRKPIKLGKVQTVNAETGEVLSEEKNAFTLLPPREGVCPECAVDHPYFQPHDQQSLYYQMAFHAKHGRWPTWNDALAHCPDNIKRYWISELMKRGVIEDGWEKYQND
jgi:hypothetical protein